jgi:ORMDL family protein
MVVRRTHPQENGFSPFPSACAFPYLLPFLQTLTRPRPHTQISFLLSTHYTNYNPWLFAINLSALIFVLVPKLPMVRLLDGSPLPLTIDSVDSDRPIASAYASSRVTRLAMLHHRAAHLEPVHPQIPCVRCQRST